MPEGGGDSRLGENATLPSGLELTGTSYPERTQRQTRPGFELAPRTGENEPRTGAKNSRVAYNVPVQSTLRCTPKADREAIREWPRLAGDRLHQSGQEQSGGIAKGGIVATPLSTEPLCQATRCGVAWEEVGDLPDWGLAS